MHGSFTDRMPETPGSALVVDDATESVHAVQIRERGGSNTAAAVRAQPNWQVVLNPTKSGRRMNDSRRFESVK